jgi:hypothetical protein
MDRGSSKHGSRLDDEMAQEVRGIVQGGQDSRVEEFNDPEPSGEDQPEASWEPGGTRAGGAPPGMTADDVEGRSRLGRFIPRTSLPGDRDGLIAGARVLNAPDDVIAELSRLPSGATYETVNQVWAALGHPNEERRT